MMIWNWTRKVSAENVFFNFSSRSSVYAITIWLMNFCVDAAQEILESLKDRWFQADTNPTDQLLNEQEFLSFLHPEHSRGMLKYMVREIVRDLGMSYTQQWPGTTFKQYFICTSSRSGSTLCLMNAVLILSFSFKLLRMDIFWTFS